jgi:hypothetical protein
MPDGSDFHSSNAYRLLVRQSAERRQRGRLGVDLRVLLKWILQNLEFKVVNFLSWLIFGNECLCL